MKLFSQVLTVGTSPTVVYTFTPSMLNSVAFQATGALELGVGGVSIGTGYPIAAGGSFGFNQDDLDKNSDDLVYVYAVAAAETNLRVFGFER